MYECVTLNMVNTKKNNNKNNLRNIWKIVPDSYIDHYYKTLGQIHNGFGQL